MLRHRGILSFAAAARILTTSQAPGTDPQTEPIEGVTMYVVEQTRPSPAPIPGLAHATWAGHDEGLQQISIWRQTLAPGAATPPHRHDCDEVVLCQGGVGELHVEDQRHRFGADSTVVLPRGRLHQIVNVGAEPLEIVGIFGATPVGTFLPGGEALAVPWRT
jgi:quercetin dioxygenase-like cupin family protein